MWFKLSDRRGVSVEYLKSTMPMKRFYEWAAYFEIELETPTITETTLACIASYAWNKQYKDKRPPSYYLPSVKTDKVVFTKKQGSDLFRGLAGLLKKAKRS